MVRRRLILVVCLIAAVSIALGSWSYVETEKSRSYSASFVGRDSCAKCHVEQAQRYTGSHHDLAMDPATDETVVDPAAFDDVEFTHFGVTSKFTRRDGKYFVTTDDADGRLREFEIKYVFGVDPLQQYMIEFPDKQAVTSPNGQPVELPAGRIQCLSIAWDTHRGRWFHLYPNQKIPPGDWLHWTGGGQNWNYMCADCHSTNLQKNFDLAENAYHTSWSEIDVSCEACHGPASEHLARAESSWGFRDPRHFHSYALNRLKAVSSLGEIETCAPCHSRRRIVHGRYVHGQPYNDYYEVEKLDGNLYFADGQIKEELYEYGSFMESRMFRENVRCSNCHDPHSLRPKFPGNSLCTQCHVPAKYDTPAHHHHGLDSSGAKCVECHMPQRTYMEVDPRRDHSIRVPRPDLTAKLGVPNACEQCHSNSELGTRNAELTNSPAAPTSGSSEFRVPSSELKDAKSMTTAELVAVVESWFPNSPIRKRPHFGEILEAGRRGEPDAGAALCDLARPRPQDTSDQRAVAVGSIVRASAVALLAGYPSQESRDALRRALDDADPLVRVAAVRTIAGGRDDVRQFKAELIKKLDDKLRDVRTEAANALTQFPRTELTPDERTLFERVFREWEDGQAATADASATNATLGNAYVRMLNSSDLSSDAAEREAIRVWGTKADAAYRRALAIDPLNVQAMLPYSKFLDIVNRDADAETWLKRALDALPHLPDAVEGRTQFVAEVQYELGWLLFRDPSGTRLGDAAAHFKLSLDAEPNNPQAWQYYGLALLGLNRFGEAEAALKRFCSLTPQAPGLLFNYARRAVQTSQPDQARVMLKVLLAVDPAAREHFPGLDEMLRELGGL